MRANLFPSRVLRVRGAQRPSPSLFHYPGLSAQPWHERSASPFSAWVGALEEAAPHITREYKAMRETALPSHYEPQASEHGAELHSGGEWHWATFIDRGRAQQKMWDLCPFTAEALRAVPNLCLGDMPFSFAFFSTLPPGGRIKPHHSPCNLRVRVHLPLIVPESQECGIRVGKESRRWEEGKCLIFDDSFEHEVWNDSDQPRAILLFDLWHWELTEDEKSAIQEMFREVEGMRDARHAKSRSG